VDLNEVLNERVIKIRGKVSLSVGAVNLRIPCEKFLNAESGL